MNSRFTLLLIAALLPALAKVYDEGTPDELTIRYDRIQSLTQ